jgi:D-alanyl-D-alanine carboxypeptidase
MKRINLLLVLMFIVALIAACGSDQAQPTATVAVVVEPTAMAVPTVELAAEPTALPPTVGTPDVGALTANPWQWVSFTDPLQQFEVEMPASYLLTFNEDGTVNIVADCNNASGSYTEDAGSLTIEVGPMTMAACPSESRSDQFVGLLGSAARYFFEDGSLYIDLFADGGTLAFAPADPELMADDGEGAMAGALPADLVAQLDAYLQSQVWTEGGDPEGAAPGLVLLVDTPEGRYLSAAGVSSIEDGIPMQGDDILEIGSNTKSMTVVLLMQLQEEGVLSMDDMLSDWLPEQAAQLPNGDQMTLRQMAQHTAGLWDYGDAIIGGGIDDPNLLEKGYTPEELVQYAVDNGTPYFAPGEGPWHYSNTGYVLLGMIAEKASGKSLGELYQERIFDPLGLETAVLIEGVPQEGEITTQGYWWTEDGQVVNTTNWNASQGWAAGAVAMSAADLATYGEALAAGELLQNEDSMAQMLVFDNSALYSVGAPYGLGLLGFGNGYWGHAGETLGFQTLWYTNPDEQITVVGLTNSASYKAYDFLNVLNILNGEGAKPFGALTLLPVGDDEQGLLGEAVASRWEWVQMADASGATDIAPGTLLVLFKDGSAKVKSDACGEAPGTFAVDPSWQISFDLDASGITCDSGEPAAQLLGILGSADTWRFENGRLAIALDDGATLLFKVAAAE